MSDNGPLLAQACPIRTVVIPETVQFQAVDDIAEQNIGHDFRVHLRKELGIPEDRSILHPDQPKLSQRQQQQPISDQAQRPKDPPPGALGIGLEKLIGTFEGTGFNEILRPQNGKNSEGASDNLLEINLTYETLAFLDWTMLKDVPNRGFKMQPDVHLRGLPYTQIVKDLANEAGGDRSTPIDTAPTIHFEQGLLMRTPALKRFKNTTFTDTEQILPPTIARMASIPHGTTINAQCVEPTKTIPGPPVFTQEHLATKIIMPFNLGEDPLRKAKENVFPQLEFKKNVSRDRIPINFPEFRKKETITEAQFNNPNNYLDENNKKKNIIEHVTFTVDTQRDLKLWGGGTNNIAQLAEIEEARDIQSTAVKPNVDPISKQSSITRVAGNPRASNNGKGESKANANAVRVTCQYWISTVEDVINVPAYDKAALPRKNLDPILKDKPENIEWKQESPTAVKDVMKPRFKFMLDKIDKPFKARVRYTQIQYFQNVTLDFGELSWPHISVATLVPKDPVPITDMTMLQPV